MARPTHLIPLLTTVAVMVILLMVIGTLMVEVFSMILLDQVQMTVARRNLGAYLDYPGKGATYGCALEFDGCTSYQGFLYTSYNEQLLESICPPLNTSMTVYVLGSFCVETVDYSRLPGTCLSLFILICVCACVIMFFHRMREELRGESKEETHTTHP